MNLVTSKPNVLLNPLFAQLGENRHVLVGFSGGLDSTVLLHYWSVYVNNLFLN